MVPLPVSAYWTSSVRSQHCQKWQTKDIQKALSATCRSLREHCIAQVRAVTVWCVKDFALVIRCRWPRLSLVVLQNERAHSCVSHCMKKGLISVYVSAEANQAVICMLHTPAADLAWAPLAAQQLAHQMRTKWPCMHTFLLSNMRLDGLNMKIVSQLVKGTWTSLVSLTLSHCELKAQGFLLLSQGNWPCLQLVNVSNNCLGCYGNCSSLCATGL